MKNIKKNFLFNKYDFNENDIFFLLNIMSDSQVDFGDIYFQSKQQEVWILDNKIIKKGTYFFDEGVGIRIVKNFSTSFSYTNSIKLENLINCTNSVCSMLPSKSNRIFKKNLSIKNNSYFYTNINSIKKYSVEKKIYILNTIDCIARKQDVRVIDVYATLTCEYEEIVVGSTDNDFISKDIRPLINVTICVIVEQNSNREKGYSGGGGRLKFDDLIKKKINSEKLIDFWAKEAVRIALVALSAKLSPAGLFPVVLGSGWPGIVFHEAVGHGLEGDFIRKETSIFSKKIGQEVASNLCTIVDDGTLIDCRGSINIDDEGTSSQYNILIKNGILKSFLQDKLNAHLMHQKSTGNGRRESYACLPIPRMTNTYLLPGIDKREDIILSVEEGIYAVNFSGGQVDITSGNFVFSTSEAYMIKNGKIIYPIKGATLIGSGIDVMKSISMVGNDLCMDSGLGICGKDGQNVPVSVGQPTIKINKLTIGGIS
ncbi:metalloprotease TldD [Buchnera aphidicola]|uniref:Metalloprotease TldD n=1 Tax=Buchnera aphidicola (Cinara strobi) TaxID=1921549 RepID=A0A3B1DLT9_9GAMM|nr:metalloprotease TldD [Buchnera aphidicola]VAX76661.1 Metalloprotease TldD [Buchnera aphidicola (Cinara strobi)]